MVIIKTVFVCPKVHFSEHSTPMLEMCLLRYMLKSVQIFMNFLQLVVVGSLIDHVVSRGGWPIDHVWTRWGINLATWYMEAPKDTDQRAIKDKLTELYSLAVFFNNYCIVYVQCLATCVLHIKSTNFGRFYIKIQICCLILFTIHNNLGSISRSTKLEKLM